MKAVEGLSSGNVNLESLRVLCNHYDVAQGDFYLKLEKYFTALRNDPILPLLTLTKSQLQSFFIIPKLQSLEGMFEVADQEKTTDSIAQLLYAITCAKFESTFHKINVHAALSPTDVFKLLEPAFSQAKKLQLAHEKRESQRMKNRTDLGMERMQLSVPGSPTPVLSNEETDLSNDQQQKQPTAATSLLENLPNGNVKGEQLSETESVRHFM